MSDQVVVLNNGRIEQIGPPEDHYQRPVSPFVAEFIGDGALFTGKIEDARNPVLVTDDGLSFAVGAGAPVGETATLLLRPEHLSIAPDRADGSLGVFDARLEQSVYYGATRQYVCRLANGTLITATSAGIADETTRQLQPGDSLRLAYQRDVPHLIRGATDGA
jgi:ABC-type Fe3+/spermidine/putrescine transport system ATPase subunit